MTEFLSNITMNDIAIFVTFISIFIEITPFKINPISCLFNKIGSAFNHSMDSRIEEYDRNLQIKINNIDQQISELKQQNEDQYKLLKEQSRDIDIAEVNRLKLEILNFGNKLSQQKKFTAEEYRTIMDCYTRYHNIIDKYDDLNNGKIDIEYNTIVNHYSQYSECGDFRF